MARLDREHEAGILPASMWTILGEMEEEDRRWLESVGGAIAELGRKLNRSELLGTKAVCGSENLATQ